MEDIRKKLTPIKMGKATVYKWSEMYELLPEKRKQEIGEAVAYYGITLKLREEREHQGITQSKLAEMTGIPRETINKIESGKRNVTIDKILKLTKALNLSFSFESQPAENIVAEPQPSYQPVSDIKKGSQKKKSLKYDKEFIQRGTRGWSDSDLFEMDTYLAKLIGEMLGALAKTTNGYPDRSVNSFEEWVEILNKLSKVFLEYEAVINNLERSKDDYDMQLEKMKEIMVYWGNLWW
jgi:transcriptional regulator with XRE-family HTH domain